MSYEVEKKIVAREAVKLVKSGMKIGIGTGSTVKPFIEFLKNRVWEEELSISCVCTSKESEQLLEDAIPILPFTLDYQLDITFDGADRFDPQNFNRIKGGGGALLREKLVASQSKKNVVLVDFSKIATPLQGFPVAVEIVPFGYISTVNRLISMGYKGVLRENLSDNGNYLFDIEYDGSIEDPISEHSKIKSVTGVIETGFFFKNASHAFIGYDSGKVEEITI